MNTLQIYAMCGVWRLIESKEWRFVVDVEKGGRLVSFQSTTNLDDLKMILTEDFDIEHSLWDVEISYMPTGLTMDFPPVVIMNDRQVKNFVIYFKRNSTVTLYATFKARAAEETSSFNINLNDDPSDIGDEDDSMGVVGNSPQGKEQYLIALNQGLGDAPLDDDAEALKLNGSWLKKGQHFGSKEALQATLEIAAMKHKFDYRITKSSTKLWCIRCVDNVCQWRVRAECLEGSTYFKINKYVGEHTCAPSTKSKFCRTPSARTIGHLMMHRYEGVKEGPKPSDIMNIMRTEYGFELSYNQAWESREYAVNEVRGIPEKSYTKLPKYLHMLKEANPGTFTNYETDSFDRFLYLFVAFGQSIRGFKKAAKQVIVVDGTFLKSKYKGVLLVATALDGNNNLYPIAFGIADSENDSSWEWFLIQLKVVIGDEESLVFVSDRHSSILKGLANVYPMASHGICIHHLLNNVITQFNGQGVVGLIAKASKSYRDAEFDKLFTNIYSISPAIEKYLEEADVTKLARCHFPGYR